MDSQLIETLKTQYQFKDFDDDKLPILDIDTLALSDFCIDDDGMLRAIVYLNRHWLLSVVNDGFMVFPFSEGLDNRWEIAFLYEGIPFKSAKILQSYLQDILIFPNENTTIVEKLSFATLNQLISDIKKVFAL